MTDISDVLNLAVPVVGAPMAGAAGGRLAAAITAAGGLGMVGVGNVATVEQIEPELAVASVAGRFGVGLMCWSLPDNPALLDVTLASSPSLISLSFGDPRPYLDRVHEAGIPVVAQVGTRSEALDVLDAGVDGVVVRGDEGGGHGRGVVATLPLLQQVLAITDKPVLAAGGIATARGLAAVLAAGAVGAWVGTPFAASEESLFKQSAKDAVIAADTDQTVYTRAFDVAQRFNWPTIYGGRALANDFTAQWADDVASLEGNVPEQLTADMKTARAQGNTAMAPVYAGESAGLVTERRTAAQVMDGFAGFRDHLRAAQRWL